MTSSRGQSIASWHTSYGWQLRRKIPQAKAALRACYGILNGRFADYPRSALKMANSLTGGSADSTRLGRPLCVPAEGAVSAWFAYFSACRTSQQYSPHLDEACVLIGHGFNWETKTPKQAAAKGSAKTGDRAKTGDGFPAPRPWTSERWNPLAGILAQAVWAIWAFFLRVQSGCEMSNGELDEA